MAFDIEKFAEMSEPVQWEDLDLDLFETQPLDANTLRSIRYMCDIEYHTSCNLRDLLVTPSRDEPAAAGFMTMWNREEFWHGEALAAVLRRHDIVVDYEQLKTKRVKLGWTQALGPLKQSVLSSLVGTDFVAVHMTWGATNELSAVAAYRRLAEMTDHPTLTPLLARIARQETRHVAFYTTQARERLEASPRARAATRLALTRAWRPVGSGIMPDSEVTHVLSHLFAHRGDDIAALDRKVSKLPGLEGLSIFHDAFARMHVPM